jgi:NIMA (never in mitosis gene a)-related kinase 1/4/5
MKRIPIGSRDKDVVMREVNLLRDMDHPNILRYHDSFVDDATRLCIVTEFCNAGDLYTDIQARKEAESPLTENEVMDIFVQVLLALHHVHGKRVLHRDLKSQNIFISLVHDVYLVKLGDFGISRVLSHTQDLAHTVTGTPYYMAPEILGNLPYTLQSDVWSLGCVLYEICCLRHAFAAENLLGLVYQIHLGVVEPIPSSYSTAMQGLVTSLLDKDPTNRPTLAQLIASPFVQGHIHRMRTEGCIYRPCGKPKPTLKGHHSNTTLAPVSPAALPPAGPDVLLPPRERMRRNRMQQADSVAEAHREAALAAQACSRVARERKHAEIYGRSPETAIHRNVTGRLKEDPSSPPQRVLAEEMTLAPSAVVSTLDPHTQHHLRDSKGTDAPPFTFPRHDHPTGSTLTSSLPHDTTYMSIHNDVAPGEREHRPHSGSSPSTCRSTHTHTHTKPPKSKQELYDERPAKATGKKWTPYDENALGHLEEERAQAEAEEESARHRETEIHSARLERRLEEQRESRERDNHRDSLVAAVEVSASDEVPTVINRGGYPPLGTIRAPASIHTLGDDEGSVLLGSVAGEDWSRINSTRIDPSPLQSREDEVPPLSAEETSSAAYSDDFEEWNSSLLSSQFSKVLSVAESTVGDSTNVTTTSSGPGTTAAPSLSEQPLVATGQSQQELSRRLWDAHAAALEPHTSEVTKVVRSQLGRVHDADLRDQLVQMVPREKHGHLFGLYMALTLDQALGFTY